MTDRSRGCVNNRCVPPDLECTPPPPLLHAVPPPPRQEAAPNRSLWTNKRPQPPGWGVNKSPTLQKDPPGKPGIRVFIKPKSPAKSPAAATFFVFEKVAATRAFLVGANGIEPSTSTV